MIALSSNIKPDFAGSYLKANEMLVKSSVISNQYLSVFIESFSEGADTHRLPFLQEGKKVWRGNDGFWQ